MRDALISWSCGCEEVCGVSSFSYQAFKEHNYNVLADTVEKQVDIKSILKQMGV
jgi:hypothetical protein